MNPLPSTFTVFSCTRHFCNSRAYFWLSVTILAASCSCRSYAQTLFSENFDDPSAALTRFNSTGNIQFRNGQVELLPGSAIFLNAANGFADSGSEPVTYTVTQTFEGLVGWPNQHISLFHVRVPSGSSAEGYRIVTASGPFVSIQRYNEDSSSGLITLIGGTGFAPNVLGLPGPHEISVQLQNTGSGVHIALFVDDIFAVSYFDVTPFRFTDGTSLGLLNGGNQPIVYDNLSVVVPEPRTSILLLFFAVAAGTGTFLRKARDKYQR